MIRKCDNDRESYDYRKCENDWESYRVPKKKWPQKKVLAIFSCWMVLYGPKQCCMMRAYRCAALVTPLAYIRKKIYPRPPGAQKSPFGALNEKNQNVRLQSHRICGRFGTNLFPVALFVHELRSFSQWPPARKSPFFFATPI